MSQDPILCVSYFDHLIGPLKLYCSEPLADVVGAPDLFKNRILEFVKKGHDEGGTFSFVYRKYQTVNRIFYIASELARGGNELMMITFITKTAILKDEIVDVFKYLDSEEELIAEINSKTPILEEFAEELKRLNGLTSFLHLRHSNFSFADEELKASFLEIFNRYLKKLNEKVLPLIKFENPLVLVIAKSDILNQLKRDYEVKGYKVITSKDTMEALKIIEERYNEISMVFIDTMMPHRGAYTILDEIKGNEKYKDIRIRSFSRRQKRRYYDWSIPPSFFLK